MTITTTAPASPVQEARDAEQTRRQELHHAKATAATLRERLQDGDSTVTAAALGKADTAIERAELLHQAAERALSRAVAAEPFTPALADILAPALAAALRVPVTVVDRFPAELPEVLPVAYVRQPRRHSADVHDGALSGAVELAFYRTELHRLADEAALSGIPSVEMRGMSTRALAGDDGGEVDTVSLRCHHLYPARPAIVGEVQAWRVSAFAQGVAQAAGKDVDPYLRADTGVRIGSGDTSAAAASIRGKVESHRLVSVEVDDDGTRLASVEVVVSAWIVDRERWTIDQLNAQAQRAITDQLGQVAPGVGRVTSAEVVSVVPTARNGRTVTGRFVLESATA